MQNNKNQDTSPTLVESELESDATTVSYLRDAFEAIKTIPSADWSVQLLKVDKPDESGR